MEAFKNVVSGSTLFLASIGLVLAIAEASNFEIELVYQYLLQDSIPLTTGAFISLVSGSFGALFSILFYLLHRRIMNKEFRSHSLEDDLGNTGSEKEEVEVILKRLSDLKLIKNPAEHQLTECMLELEIVRSNSDEKLAKRIDYLQELSATVVRKKSLRKTKSAEKNSKSLIK